MRRAIITTLVLLLMAIASTAYGQADPEANDPDFWCEPGQGIKYEPVDTPFIVPEPEEGRTWTLLVLKAATTNETVVNPTPGVGYSHSSGQDNSHTILCWEAAVAQVTTTTGPTTTTSSSTTVPTTTTTIPLTTTTDPATTTSSSTTTTSTTVIVTTTDPPSSSTTSLSPPSTVQQTTTTVAEELPNTGAPIGALLLTVVGLLILGSAAVIGTRREV